MTAQTNPGYPPVTPWLPDEAKHRREITRTVNLHNTGHMNVTLDVTLPSGSTSYTITDARIGFTTAVLAVALNSDAATMIQKGYWTDTFMKGSCVLHYPNSGAAVDLNVRLVLIG